jgi:hypothetical protein
MEPVSVHVECREGLSRDADACCVSCLRGKVMSLGSVQPRGCGGILVAKVRHLHESFLFFIESLNSKMRRCFWS